MEKESSLEVNQILGKVIVDDDNDDQLSSTMIFSSNAIDSLLRDSPFLKPTR